MRLHLAVGDEIQGFAGFFVGKHDVCQLFPVQNPVFPHAGEVMIRHTGHGAVPLEQFGVNLVGVQYLRTHLFQSLGKQAFAAARAPGDANDAAAFPAVYALEAGGLAQTVDRSGVGTHGAGTLHQDALCLCPVELAQQGKEPSGVFGVIPAVAQRIDQPGAALLDGRQKFFKADHARPGGIQLFQKGAVGVPGGTLKQDHRGFGGIMPVFHAGRAHFGIVGQTFQGGTVGGNGTHSLPDHLLGDGTGTEDLGIVPRHIHHGGFHAHRAGAAVHDGRNLAVHVVQHVPCGGGRGLARGVCRGGGQRHSRRINDGSCHRMRGHTDAHRVQPGRGAVGDHSGLFDHHGQRAGPEMLGHLVDRRGNVLCQPLQLLQSGDVNDQRIVLGAPLGFKDAQNGRLVQGVCRQTVHRFGGDSNHGALTKQGAGFCNIRF